MSFGGWDFEKGKRGNNEPKVTLFTIDTEINERNLMFEKKILKNIMNLGVPLKGSKHVLNILFGIFAPEAVPRFLTRMDRINEHLSYMKQNSPALSTTCK